MIHLRKANLADLPILMQWDQQEHVIAADPNDDWNWEVELTRDVDWRMMFIAHLEERPIGFIQIIDPATEETHYWGNIAPNKRAIDIWIGSPDDLNKGYGSEMMKLALAICFSDEKVQEVLIDPLSSNTDAIRFYKRLGFEFLEQRQFGEDLTDVYVLSRSNWAES